MDNLLYTGQFPCHLGLPVNGICFDTPCEGASLCCVDCILKKHAKHVDKIFSIPQLVKEADQHYTMMQNVRSIEEPSIELKELLNKQDESLTNLTLHITKEKVNVEQMINEVQQSFITMTNEIKETFNKELDAQIEILNANYTTYRSLYDSFYRGDQVKCSEFPSLADVMNRLNKSNDKKDLEKHLKKLHDDIMLGSSLPETLEEKISKMKTKITGFSQGLKNQITSKPSAAKLINEVKEEVKKHVGELVNHFEKNKEDLC
jgi:hypothetical protein